MAGGPSGWVKATFGADPDTYAQPGQDGGGMSAVTPDGAGYSAPGTAPDSSQAPAPADDGGGGSSAATPDGAGYSAQGKAPDSSQAPAPAGDGGGGSSAVTPDGAGYSAPGKAPDSSQAPAPAGDGTAPAEADGGAEGAGGTSGGQEQQAGPANGDKRPLTGAEKSYAHDIFQDTLDYGVIEINYNGLGSTGSSRTIGNTIEMTADEFVPGTFNLTGKGQETLVHEMTHVWQYQHTGAGYAPAALWAQFVAWITTGTRNAAYDWVKLRGDGVPWADWNPEAQAEAVERYNQALRAINAGKGTADDYKDFGLLKPYVDAMIAGPPKQPANGGAQGAGGAGGGSAGGSSAGAGGDPADAGTPGANDEE